MSIFGAGSKTQPTTPSSGPQTAQTTVAERSEATSGGGQNIIGKGTVIKGDIETAGNLRIDGKVKGHVRCSGTLSLGQGAVVEGDIATQKAELAGDVIGNVEATELLTLKSTANIKGDLYTAKIIIEVGAMFNGNCNMGAATKQINIPQQAAAK